MDNSNGAVTMVKRYLNTLELAAYLGKSRWWVYGKVKHREIPFTPVGREPRFDIKVIDDWMAKRMIKAFK